MKLKELLEQGIRTLKENNIDEAELQAEILLAHSLGLKRNEIYLKYDSDISPYNFYNYKSYLDRKLNFEPVQYITEKTCFMGIEFFTPCGVFIPRPETEILVENLIQMMRKKDSPLLFDIGAGSGVIGISALHFVKDAFCISSDISSLLVAKKNAENIGVEDRIRFIQGSLFEPYKGRADFIVSNPPYIKRGEIPFLQREIKDFEPLHSIDGGENGLEFIEKIIVLSPKYLKEEGTLLIEIGDGQKDFAVDIAKEHFSNIKILDDLNGIPRVLICYKWI